jgi:lipid II:glycine glycyltransferase (peptidoglycan interpeptide bridge formation enzyme)
LLGLPDVTGVQTCALPICLNLFADVDFLFSKLQSPVRRAIRKAEKSQVTVETSQSLDAVRAYYSLHCRTRRQHGLPPQPFRFFRHIQEQVLTHNHGVVVTARYGGRPIASAVFFHAGAEAIYKFGASDKRFHELRANNLVMWEAIKRYASRGFKILDFGRTSLADEGLRRYKLGWGVDEYRINYYRYDLRRESFVAGADKAHGWHNRLFRALPLFLARLTGAVLYRHVA